MVTYISASAISGISFCAINQISEIINSLREREKKYCGCSDTANLCEKQIGLIGGVETVGAHLTYYKEDGFKGLTLVGEYCCSYVGESNYSCRYSGDYDLTLGCASVANHYVIHTRISNLSESGWQKIISSAYKRLEYLSEVINEIEGIETARRKEYGQAINDVLNSLGFSKSAIQVYWKMNWRKEISPVEFSNYVLKAKNDIKSFRAALASNSTKDLERFEWKVRPSVPRTQSLLSAIAEVIGVQPMTFDELQDYKDVPGKWVFGE